MTRRKRARRYVTWCDQGRSALIVIGELATNAVLLRSAAHVAQAALAVQ